MPPAPVRIPSQMLFAPSVTSVMSVANDNDENSTLLLKKFKVPSHRPLAPSVTSVRSVADDNDNCTLLLRKSVFQSKEHSEIPNVEVVISVDNNVQKLNRTCIWRCANNN